MNGARRKSWPTGGDVVIIACGPLLGRALEAGRQLQEQKIAATVISNPFVNRVDLETIGAAVRKCSGRVVTIEDHQAICGMGAQVAHQLAQAGIAHRMKTLAHPRRIRPIRLHGGGPLQKARPDQRQNCRGGAGTDALEAHGREPPNPGKGNCCWTAGNCTAPFSIASVVLICQHDAEGRLWADPQPPGRRKVGDAVVANLPRCVKEQPLYIGGPVQPGTLSFLHSDVFVPHANVMPNLNLGHSIESLMDLGESYSSTQKLRLFAGYAGWSAGQLEQEMARKDWLVHPADAWIWCSSPSPDQLWKEILRQKEGPLRWLADSPENPSWN